jgi:hypothetical protein
MARRLLSRPPNIGTGSRAANNPVRGQLPTAVQKFKNTYVFERRILQRFRATEQNAADYIPAASLDGKSRWDTPEEKTKVASAWETTYRKLSKSQDLADPCKYVRIIFYILRGSSVAIPTVIQLATPKMLELAAEFLQDRRLEIRQMFVSENQRAQASICINQKGAGYPLGLSVYFAIVDSRLGLSPLFRYCLAIETVRQLEEEGVENENCEKLKNLANQFKLFAAMDYTLFPDHYDEIWGSVIPSDFRVAACSLLDAALEQ